MRRILVSIVWVAALPVGAESSAEGRWVGSARLPGREIPLIVDLARDASGAWGGSLVIPGFDVKGAALANVKVRANDIAFETTDALGGGPDAPPVTFAARLEADAAIAGEMRHAGNAAPFSLRRAGAAQVEPPRRSTPVSAALEGRWVGRYELAGYPRDVTVDIANEGAAPRVDFVIVGKATTKLPVDFVAEQEGSLRIESRPYGITFEGRIREGAIEGTFEQGLFELPLTLRRPS